MYKRAFLIQVFCLLIISGSNAQMKPDWIFHDEMIRGLESAKDTIYIQNRKKLERCTGLRNFRDSAVINYKTSSGDSIRVTLVSQPFSSSNHKTDQLKQKNFIDHKVAYGVDHSRPKKEIKELKIKWGKTWIRIPEKAWNNLYNPDGTYMEAYVSKQRKLLYVYLQGGDAAGSYSVKFVFSQTSYITRLPTTNECMEGFDFLDAKTAY